MSTIILNVVIILGIIIAGGFLIFFVGDLLLSIIDPKSDDRKIKAKRKRDVEEFNEKLKELDPKDAEEIKNREEVKEILALAEKDNEEVKAAVQAGGEVSAYVEEEQEPQEPQEEEKEEEEEQDDEQERRIAEAREALERRKAEILRRLQGDDSEDEEEEEAEEESENEEEVAVVEEPVVEEETPVEIEEEKEVEEDTVAQQSELLEQERKALEEERARYQALILELQQKQAEVKNAPVVEEEQEVVSGSKEDYMNQLQAKEEALAANEKELRACNKEYKPLNKVQKTLEKDEKKLRIKEAQVAKQKVVLYGVNNYADIDEEKAKKLEEELDLLDGLKLSVQHCREVMEANKDRLPILERMYNVLTKQNQELKADIEYLKSMIAKFEE